MKSLIIYFCFSCPQCHKRLGNSVIAVHAPRYVSIGLYTCAGFSDARSMHACSGEVTHYQCREPFSRHLLNTRG